MPQTLTRPAAPKAIPVVLLALCLALFALAGAQNPALFHILAELVCVVAATATFLVVWNARAYVEHSFFMIVGLAFLAAAGFDTLHLLGATGFGLPLVAPQQADALRADGHLLLAITLCVGCWLLGHRLMRTANVVSWTVGGTTLLTAALLVLATNRSLSLQTLSILGRDLPLVLFSVAAIGLWRNRTHLAPSIVTLLLAMFACLGFSGLFIDFSPTGNLAHILGHTIKVLGYCLGCRAIVVTGMSRPYTLLFDELGRRENELDERMVRLTAQARAIFDLSSQTSLETGEFRAFAATLLTKAAAVTNVSRSGVWVLSPNHDTLLCQHGHGEAKTDEGLALGLAGFPDFYQAMAHERAIAADNALAAPLTRELAPSYLAPRGITSMLEAPFRFSGRLAGVLCLEHTGPARHWTDDEQAFAGSLADLLSLALETAERRRAAGELAESEQRLRSLLDAMPDPVCFKDATGHWLVANQAQIEVFGLQGTNWQGATDTELAGLASGDSLALATAHPTDPRTWEARSVAVSGLSLTTPDGRGRHFDVIKAPLFHEDGRPMGLVVLSRDITAYREALARLRESNAELEAIYNETSDGLIIADARPARAGSEGFAIVRVNTAACRLFKTKPPSLTDQPLWRLHPDKDREASLAIYGDIADGTRHFLENVACLAADGSVFFADIAFQPITYGGGPAILGFYRDITSRRAAEKAIKASEDRFRKIFNSTYDAIFLLDADGTILDVNEQVIELFGVRPEEATALSFAGDYSHPDNPLTDLRRAWGEVMAGGERFFEWKARRPHDGSLFFAEIYLRRLDLADRRVILATLRDVTERKRVLTSLGAKQKEISDLNRDLARRVREETEKNRQKDLLLLNQSRLAAMGEMIGNIAHQWRQPLNALSILLANIRFDCEEAGADSDQLRASHRQAAEILRNMSSTIDDFRDFFRPDKERAPFRVVEAVGDALLLVDAALTQRAVKVRFVARHDPIVLGFRGEFSQVVLNLLSNAKEAIAAHGRTDGCITIRVMRRLGHAVVHLYDNGGGIPPEVRQRIFDPYFTTKRDQGGTGLGLYMSRTIIEDHMGGSLETANVADGTRMIIRIPLVSPASNHARPILEDSAS